VTTPASVLRDAFERHTWSTLRLLDHLAGLGRDANDTAVDGTFGTIAETLTHLVDADARYLDRLDDPDLPPLAHRERPEALEKLRMTVVGNADRWRSALDRLEAGTLHAAIGPHAAHPNIDPAETVLLLQALHHADDHRAQVCTALGASGADVPDVSAWAFWETVRLGRR
jgi:uncharacterized damage-inducible protein DinB